jgi:hypothetical protein
MSPEVTFTCAVCGQALYVGQPMNSGGGDWHAHVACSVWADLESRYGAEALQRCETLPALTQSQAA